MHVIVMLFEIFVFLVPLGAGAFAAFWLARWSRRAWTSLRERWEAGQLPAVVDRGLGVFMDAHGELANYQQQLLRLTQQGLQYTKAGVGLPPTAMTVKAHPNAYDILAIHWPVVVSEFNDTIRKNAARFGWLMAAAPRLELVCWYDADPWTLFASYDYSAITEVMAPAAQPKVEPSPGRRPAALTSADGSTTPLLGEVVKIGRAPDSDLVLTSPSASRTHARIVWSRGSWSIHDMSMHGTTVNNVAVTEVILNNGDEIGFGSETFVFAAGSGSQPLARTREMSR